jgi:glycosyltransferase involved in cell wall biosynthesis
MIGPNEYICQEYQRRYEIPHILVHNPCDKEELEEEPFTHWPDEVGKIKILYTGAIYHANFDCFRNLIIALESLEIYRPELHVFTAQTASDIEIQGIKHNRLYLHDHIPYKDVLGYQRQADILFLPLGFASPYPEVIRTSAPGKLGEYLASGRPILAHVPGNSFVAYYLKKHQCGWIVEQNNPVQLADVIIKIIKDAESRNRFEQNALERAKIDFSPSVARDQFLRLLHH